MNTTAKIDAIITYCVPWGYHGLALWVGGEIFTAGGSKVAITLVPGAGGVFIVTLNGETVYDKSLEDRYPTLPDIKIIKDRVISLITNV